MTSQFRPANLGATVDQATRPITRLPVQNVPVDVVLDPATIATLVADCLASRRQLLVTFVNPSSPAAARRNDAYRKLLPRFDLVLPDGTGMCLAVSLTYGVRPARVSFDTTSLAPIVLAVAAQQGLRVALVGGQPGQAENAAVQMRAIYPELDIVAAFDGYGERSERVSQVLELNPDVMICGMGVGAQEAFLIALREAGWAGCGFTCGGYLDQLADGFRYYPQWVDDRNIRWAYRLYREPRRLWKRYFLVYPVFCWRTGLAALAAPAVLPPAVPPMYGKQPSRSKLRA